MKITNILADGREGDLRRVTITAEDHPEIFELIRELIREMAERREDDGDPHGDVQDQRRLA